MPKLSNATKNIRQAQALQVLTLTMQGVSLEDACLQTGISLWQYRRWSASNDKAIAAVRDARIAQEKSLLTEINLARAAAIRRLTNLVQGAPLPAKDLIEVDKHLKEVQEELTERYGAQAEGAEAEQFLLSGPKANKPPSRFSARVTQTTTTLEVQSGEYRPEPPGEIIDGTIRDL